LAQTVITISGKVTDEKGVSIAGATVTEKGTAKVLPCFIDYNFVD
jgi:hypothetical protein